MYLLDPERGPERRRRAERRLRSLWGALETHSDTAVAVRRRFAPTGERYRHDDLLGPDAASTRRPGGAARRVARPGKTGALVSVAGGALAVYGLTRRGPLGSAFRSLGTTMLAGSLQDVGAPQQERRRAVDAQMSVSVGAPAARVFALVSRPALLTGHFANVQSIVDLGEGRWRWAVRDARGAPVEWVSRVTLSVPNEAIGWRSEPDAVVEASGTIRLRPDGARTRVDVRLSYSPPAGTTGRAAAEMLGVNPRRQLNDDLARLKQLAESDRDILTREH